MAGSECRQGSQDALRGQNFVNSRRLWTLLSRPSTDWKRPTLTVEGHLLSSETTAVPVMPIEHLCRNSCMLFAPDLGTMGDDEGN